ncbi:hypothetical protein, partial [Thalassobacter sp. 16PALIMAR09]|uniref:hypothetical protein n=1 Tax=Thalassobacter sp. 16PALIMAR09 TaxID=1225651 RepID=UPI001F475BE1
LEYDALTVPSDQARVYEYEPSFNCDPHDREVTFVLPMPGKEITISKDHLLEVISIVAEISARDA